MKIVDSGFPRVSIYFLMSPSHAGNIYIIICFEYVQELVPTHILSKHNISISKQEAHGPHRSPEKTVQINKHI